jgi:hypothetical protein
VNRQRRDPDVEALLDLDGQIMVVDAKGEYWVKFSAWRVETTAERPGGIRYSLTLHGSGGERLSGFDNAHVVRKSRRPGGAHACAHDHMHHLGSVRPYAFRDAATLVEDFWTAVDRFLKERGIVV